MKEYQNMKGAIKQELISDSDAISMMVSTELLRGIFKEIADLEATVTRQREFIEKYAFHQPDCPVLRHTSTVQVHECQCGYTQGMKALKEAP